MTITAAPLHGTGTFAYVWSVASGSCPGFVDSGASTLSYDPSLTTTNCVLTVTITDTGTTGGATPTLTATPPTNAAVTVGFGPDGDHLTHLDPHGQWSARDDHRDPIGGHG